MGGTKVTAGAFFDAERATVQSSFSLLQLLREFPRQKHDNAGPRAHHGGLLRFCAR